MLHCPASLKLPARLWDAHNLNVIHELVAEYTAEVNADSANFDSILFYSTHDSSI